MTRYVMQTLKYQEIALRFFTISLFLLKIHTKLIEYHLEHPIILKKYTSLPCCNTYKIVHSLYKSEQINQQAKIYESVKKTCTYSQHILYISREYCCCFCSVNYLYNHNTRQLRNLRGNRIFYSTIKMMHGPINIRIV